MRMIVALSKVGKGGKIGNVDKGYDVGKVVANKWDMYGKVDKGVNTPKVVDYELNIGPAKWRQRLWQLLVNQFDSRYMIKVKALKLVTLGIILLGLLGFLSFCAYVVKLLLLLVWNWMTEIIK